MHFVALGSFINWCKDQLVHHIFSLEEDNEMVPCALIYYLYSDLGAIPKCFKEGSAFGLDQPKLNGISIAPLQQSNMRLHTP
ncbi:hypothetical protein C4D60_Mb00t04050 [Musa balbisiana]|uniref:Uncharacterized protein n=1 Tax=Musa balbisiana TaxID=52838 RepID=A0A4S8I7C2_MUSBA|nr:hypothetical protein C4D60_Mb00t04050 [Musa balbisiana]